MKKTHGLYLSTILFFSFACSFFSSIPIEPVPITPEAIPQEEAQSLPAEDVVSSKLPIAVTTEKDGTLFVFDREGYTLQQINIPGVSYADEYNLHILSVFPHDNTGLPILYYSFEQNNSLLMTHNGQTSTLLSVPEFSGMVGADGKAVLAYTRVEYAEENLISHLYAGTISSLPTAAPVYTENNAEGWGLVALAVDVEAEKPVGIWYSKRPWGIGGDIVFDPRRTLSYIDLRTGTNSQYLGADANPSAISAEGEWLAYTNDEGAVAGAGTMAIRNIQTGEGLSYPLQNAVDQRGAGEASFSPNNEYLAWMEGSGFQMAETPNFHSVVRVGNLNGNIIAEFADTAFLAASGLGKVARVEPVGWFDDNTLIVMARGEAWNDAVLLLIDIPTQNISYLAQGVFTGFVYP
ncbi:MAG: hypothetical protein GY755_22050 [Chloroflexi bacterium]|nr:hypothetical protein [Chloroflexota bacterium]